MVHAPNDAYVFQQACQIAIDVKDTHLLNDCSHRLDELEPEATATWLFRMYARFSDRDPAGARAALEGAHARGLPDATYRAIVEQIDRPPWPIRLLRVAGMVLAAWFAGFAVLLFLGDRLNKRALASAAEPARQAHPAAGELRLRQLYRRVLFVACVAYYVSLPLVAVTLIVGAVGVVLAVQAAGFIAIKLFVLLAILVVGTFSSIVKAIFVRTEEGDADAELDLAANPKLEGVLREVADAVGTRPVDRVILTPGTEVAVFDRGQLSTQLRGKGERCLVLGVGVLEGMQLRSFKAVLAHEYGHFKNEDTSGFGFALAVRRSLRMMIVQLIARRVATPFNPAWWFVRGFSRVFLRISQGASRLQEVLADRAAAFAYGSAAFEDGLRHVIERGVRFDANVNVIVEEVAASKTALPNLYAFVPATWPASGEVEAAIAQRMDREPSESDSHPAPRDRFKWVRALATEGSAAHESDASPAWSLFADRPALESAMTTIVRARLEERRGLVIAAS